MEGEEGGGGGGGGWGSGAPGGGAVVRLARELRELQREPCEGIAVHVNEANVADVQADIRGPEGTPFEGGIFRMRLAIGPDYPQAPPKGYFVTQIFHPNIATSGEICVNTLKRDWQPTHGLRHILMVIRCLLIEPFPESALNEEASSLLLEDYAEYEKNARLVTQIHAAPRLGGGGAGAASGAGASSGSNGIERSNTFPLQRDTANQATSLQRTGSGPPLGATGMKVAGKKLDKKRSLRRL